MADLIIATGSSTPSTPRESMLLSTNCPEGSSIASQGLYSGQQHSPKLAQVYVMLLPRPTQFMPTGAIQQVARKLQSSHTLAPAIGMLTHKQSTLQLQGIPFHSKIISTINTNFHLYTGNRLKRRSRAPRKPRNGSVDQKEASLVNTTF